MIFRDVYCEECGVRILKSKANKVTREYRIFSMTSPLGTQKTDVKFYCSIHAPRYKKEDVNGNQYAWFRVDYYGEPIGYVKEKIKRLNEKEKT